MQERILKDPADNDIANVVYEYDLENNINRITSELGAYSFDYDNLYRLTNADFINSKCDGRSGLSCSRCDWFGYSCEIDIAAVGTLAVVGRSPA